jgi:GDP-4-dehydro-6-deoxy-D-mannose reductase
MTNHKQIKSSVPPGTALITGAGGFAGSHLADLLVAQGFEVHAALAPAQNAENISHLKRQVRIVRFDLRNPGKVRQVIDEIRPNVIFHLAAFSSVGQSFEHERLTYEINFLGTLNLFEAAAGKQTLKRLSKVVVVSSADVYGAFTPRNQSLTEETTLAPISPYGVSKAAMERLAQYHIRRYGIPITIVRPFNHTGPRQSDIFVLPGFAKQIAGIIELGRKPLLRVGALSVKRDFSDVRDIVAGYALAAEKGKPGEVYQLCSGRAVKIEAALKALIRLSGRKITTQVDPARLRPADIPVLRGDNSKATKELGYAPRYTLQTTLADTLAYWRQRIR